MKLIRNLSLLFKEEKVIYKYVDKPCFINNCYTVEITNINIPFFEKDNNQLYCVVDKRILKNKYNRLHYRRQKARIHGPLYIFCYVLFDKYQIDYNQKIWVRDGECVTQYFGIKLLKKE